MPFPRRVRRNDSTLSLGGCLINAAGAAVIDRVLADAKRKSGTVNISATGYTDSFGSEDYNLKLSLQRADAVRDALIKGGISADQINGVRARRSRPCRTNREWRPRAS